MAQALMLTLVQQLLLRLIAKQASALSFRFSYLWLLEMRTRLNRVLYSEIQLFLRYLTLQQLFTRLQALVRLKVLTMAHGACFSLVVESLSMALSQILICGDLLCLEMVQCVADCGLKLKLEGAVRRHLDNL